MATNIEIEAKCLISKEDYNKIIDFYHADKYDKVKQVNHYIDTDDLRLNRAGFGLRIREKDDGFIINLKSPLAEGLLEKNEKISWREFEQFRDDGVFPNCGIKEFITMLNIDPKELKIQTTLNTERLQIENFKEQGDFAIDKNTYNGITDYELELEGNSLNKVKEALKLICEEAGIHYEDNQKNKQIRALETVKH